MKKEQDSQAVEHIVISEADIRAELEAMVADGLLELTEEGFRLTEKGQAAAEAIALNNDQLN